jgi:hypothetical protein
MPASFKDQLAIVDELLAEVRRMEDGEKRASSGAALDAYERELRLAGLAQRIAQCYTMMEGVLAYVSRRIDDTPVAGEDWHRQVIARCAQSLEPAGRPALLSAALASDLLELCQFRHVVRNVYPTRLDKARVKANFLLLARAVPAFHAECRLFAARLPAARRGRKR